MGHGPLRVLVADDEPAIREVICDFLGMEQYAVATAQDGGEAIAMLAAQPFDLVLTDLEMPRVNGISVLKHIKTLPHPPLAIIMTGYATVENAIEAMRVGAYDYMLKPFKIDEVLHTLHKAAEKLRLERENLQLRQAVSLYYVSEALSLSLPLDTVFDVVLDTALQQLDADGAGVLLSSESQDAHVRKRKARRSGVAEIFSALRWDSLASVFQTDQVVTAVGHELAAFFKGNHEPGVSLLAIPLRARSRVLGALVCISTQGCRRFHEGERRLLSILASQAATALDNAELLKQLQRTFTSTIEGLVVALEAKDEYTAGHSQRVARWAEIIASLAGFNDEEVQRVQTAALLHDVGKIGVDQAALTKPAKLTPEEFEAFKSHPVLSRKILEPLTFLGPVVLYVYHHHERYDGLGYPHGLKGEDIPLGARILCLADSFEVMATDRAYRKRLPRDLALAELRRCAGTHFDPHLTNLLVEYLEKFSTFKEAMENPAIGRPHPLIAAVLTET